MLLQKNDRTSVTVAKPKVLHILYSGLGGHGNVFFSLINADKKNEFLWHALFCGIEPLRNEYEHECIKRSIPFNYVQKKPGLDFRSYKKILEILKREQPTIVFLHGSSFIIPAWLYKIGSGKRKIIIRDTQAHHLKSKVEWFWLFWAIIFANNIVCLTNEAASIIKRKFKLLLPAKKIRVIPNGIQIRHLQKKSEDDKKHFVFGMQGRLQKIKDHSTLIKAFSILSKLLPDYKFQLRLAGNGETMQELQKLAIDLKIIGNVEFCGLLDQEELEKFMDSLQIYIHASHGETMSTAIMQAMVNGLPIIASDVQGINNMINEKTGILVPANNAELLASKMKDLVLNYQKRETLGASARRYAEECFSDERMFYQYKSLFNTFNTTN